MKKILLLLFLKSFTIIGIVQAQTIKNRGFELWSTVQTEEPPPYYLSNSDSYENINMATAFKVTGHSGNFAIKVETRTNGIDTSAGYFANGSPDMAKPEGGVPFTEKPDSITGYFKCGIPNDEKGLLLVLFKKGGLNIGMTLCEFNPGTITNFTRFSFKLNPLSQNPDSVIIAVASGNAIDDNAILVPGSYLIIDDLSFTGGAGNTITQNVINAGFENWMTKTSDDLIDWLESNHTIESISVSKSTDAHDGKYAVRIETVKNSFGNVDGMITNGRTSRDGERGGQPLLMKKDTLYGYYKYTVGTPVAPYTSDSAEFRIGFIYQDTVPYWSGSATAGKDLVAASEYTYFEIPFDVTSATYDYDSVRISVQSYKWRQDQSKIANGSVLYLDGMHLKSEPVLNSFSFGVSKGKIAGDSIWVHVPDGEDLSGLVASFSKSYSTTVKVGGVTQVSGTSPNDFSSIVVYEVTGANGATVNYKVKVMVDIVTGSTTNKTAVEKLNLYPNPVKDGVIYFNKFATVSISDMTGRILISNNGASVDVSSLQKGMYFIKSAEGDISKFFIE